MIARSNVEIGTKLGDGLTCRSQVPSGHKIATRAIKKGEPILKYNVTIGFAAADIAPGTFVHSHNMEFREFDRDYAYARDYRPVQMIPESERATFMGIVRANGQVATRNYIGVLSTVNCSATVVHKIAEYFTPERLAEYPNIDGVVAFAHGTGCGMEMTGEPMDLLRRTMAGYALHAESSPARWSSGWAASATRSASYSRSRARSEFATAHVRHAGRGRHDARRSRRASPR